MELPLSCWDKGIPQWEINDFFDEKIAALECHRDEMERVWAQEKSQLAIESAEAKVACERSAAAVVAARTAAEAAGAAEKAVRVAVRAGGTQEELVSVAITAAATVVHNAGDPLSQEELDEFLKEIAVEAKNNLKSLLGFYAEERVSQEELDECLKEIAVEAEARAAAAKARAAAAKAAYLRLQGLPIPGLLVRQTATEVLDGYDSDGLGGYCVGEHVDNGFPEPLDMRPKEVCLDLSGV